MLSPATPSTVRNQENNLQKKAYRTPSIVEFGAIVRLTEGSGSSVTWDMGHGYRNCGGSGSGPDKDQQC